MAEDGEDEYTEVKLIFIGGEKQTSQRMIDKYIETLKNEDRLLSTGEDETKPIISLVNGMKTKLILSTTDGKDKYSVCRGRNTVCGRRAGEGGKACSGS